MSVSVGNSTRCGPFAAKVVDVNATNVTLDVYYDNIYVNQSVFGPSSEKPFNFGSNGTFWIYMSGPVPSNRSAYFLISTDYVVCTTVTIPTLTTSIK